MTKFKNYLFIFFLFEVVDSRYVDTSQVAQDTEIGPNNKNNFLLHGCSGEDNASKFARLDRLCKDCHEQRKNDALIDVNLACRYNCFRNDQFDLCVTAVNASEEVHQKAEDIGGEA